eukprot:CAMPEP_0206028560 /NCGR_PEP_ID=MMETSP1464-20131121/45138_1 /ASSEMBLY_ACC=CAM_ASM_001124 /TAXON_ID=119497 /ORGANISM="Exanthemachrysis gayraliae, Strain RCC1523" /LENGTH=182 /DNA_ID=CAMNT_0053402623 /DNA_START=406 /DNA_END=951 /DNA_ORIENTATION=-
MHDDGEGEVAHLAAEPCVHRETEHPAEDDVHGGAVGHHHHVLAWMLSQHLSEEGLHAREHAGFALALGECVVGPTVAYELELGWVPCLHFHAGEPLEDAKVPFPQAWILDDLERACRSDHLGCLPRPSKVAAVDRGDTQIRHPCRGGLSLRLPARRQGAVFTALHPTLQIPNRLAVTQQRQP